MDTPNNVSQTGEKNITITMDPKAPEETSTLWLVTDWPRQNGMARNSKNNFPAEKQYRHSLAEEADALTMAATVWTEANESDKKKKKGLRHAKDANLILLLSFIMPK